MGTIDDARITPETGTVDYVYDKNGKPITVVREDDTRYITSVDGRNVGIGFGIFAGPNGAPNIILDFKTLVAGPGISLSADHATITITNEGGGEEFGSHSFLALNDAPDSIVANGILLGNPTGDRLLMLAPPTSGYTTLVFDGSSYSYRPHTQGTVTSVGLTGSDGIAVTGSTITTAGTLNVGLANSGVSAGTYTAATISVDAKGRVTAATSTPVGEINTVSALGNGIDLFTRKLGTAFQFKSLHGNGIVQVSATSDDLYISANAVTSVALAAGTGLVVSGSPITSSGTISVGLANTAVVPGNYVNPTLTVDAQGRVTSISSGVSGSVSSVSAQGTNGIVVTGSPITSSGNFIIGLGNSAVTAGSYTAANITVDQFGRVTAAANGTTGEVNTMSEVGSGFGLFKQKAGSNFVMRTIASETDYLTVSVSPDDNTLIINAENIGTVMSVNATGSQGITVTGGPIASTGTFAISLANTGVTAGSYTAATIEVDAQGRIVTATSNPLGETNAAANLGSGDGHIYSSKTGATLNLRSLKSGTGVAISETATEITIGMAPSVLTQPKIIAPVSALPRYRIALNDTQARPTILVVGGSAVAGQSTGTGNLQATTGWPAQLAQQLQERGINASANSFMGGAGFWGGPMSFASYKNGDSRFSGNTGAVDWGSAVAVGGNALLFTGSGSVTFTPVGQVTKFDIYTNDTTVGRDWSWSVDGGPITTISGGTSGVRKTTVSAGSLGSHSLTLAYDAGTVIEILGIVGYDDTRREITILNGGICDAGSATFLASSGALNRSTLPVKFGAHLVLFDGGIYHDWRNGVPVATVKESVSLYVQNVRASGCDIALVLPPFDGATTGMASSQADYITAMYEVAAEQDIPFIDARTPWGSYASGNTFNLYSDVSNPSVLGYSDIAELVKRKLLA